MAELRRDPVVGRWIIVDVNNSQGPDYFDKETQILKQETTCQLCYGREYQTPPEIEAVRPAHTQPNSPGWQLRVVANKFPALRIEGDPNRRGIGIFDVMNGIGAHEVLIETPVHNKGLADFTNQEMLEVVRKYQSRSRELAKDKRLRYILIFKNFGESAGASLEHGHSQIIALPMVPKYVLEELEGAKNYHGNRGQCIFCDMIAQEHQDKDRIVVENKEFIAFCPFVPRYPFECWIMPKKHNPYFPNTNDDEMYHFACILKEVLARIKMRLSNCSYNFYLHTAPVNYEGQESYHWHVEIIPNLTRIAGFEWGTGFYVVPTAPQDAARYLREINFNFTV